MSSKPQRKKEKKGGKQNPKKDKKKKYNRNDKDQQKKQQNPEQNKESNPNEIDIKNLFHLDQEELDHKKYLQDTYRDRAKERRDNKNFDYIDESELQELQNQNIAEDHMFGNAGEYVKNMKKGLDIDLYRTELEELHKKEDEELLQEQQKNELIQKNNQNPLFPSTSENKKPKSGLAMAIERVVMIQKHQQQQQLQQHDHKQIQASTSFKCNTTYEYDLHHEFSSDLPKVIIKTSNRAAADITEHQVIPMINLKLIKKIDKILTYIKGGGQLQQQKKKDKNKKINNNDEDDDIFEDLGKKNVQEMDDEDAIFASTSKQNNTSQNDMNQQQNQKTNEKRTKLFSISPSRSANSKSSSQSSKSKSLSKQKESKQKYDKNEKQKKQKKKSSRSSSSSSSSSSSRNSSYKRRQRRKEKENKHKYKHRKYSRSRSRSDSDEYRKRKKYHDNDKYRSKRDEKYSQNDKDKNKKKEEKSKKILEKKEVDKVEPQQHSSIFQNLSVKTNKKLENEEKQSEIKIDDQMIHDIKRLQTKALQEVRKKVIQEDDSYMECYPVNDTTLLEMKQQKDQFGTGLIDTFKVKKEEQKWQPKHGKRDADQQLQKIEKFMKNKKIKKEEK